MATPKQIDRLTEEQFSERVSLNLDQLRNYARSVAGDAADDVMGETLLALTMALRRGVGPTSTNFDSYVRVSIRNEAANLWRKQRHEVQVENLVEVSDNSLPRHTPDITEQTWNSAAIRKAFEQLPSRSQQILYLSEVERMKYSEIASRLGLSENATYVTSLRARETLRVNYLVSLTEADSVCGQFDLTQLATFSRGRAAARRTIAIRQHLAVCSRCSSTVLRMREIRLPVSALAAIGILVFQAGVSILPATKAQAFAANIKTSRGWTLLRSAATPPAMHLSAAAAVGLLAASGVVVALLGASAAPPVADGTGSTRSATGAVTTPTRSAEEQDRSSQHQADTGVKESGEVRSHELATNQICPDDDEGSKDGKPTVNNGDNMGCLQSAKLLINSGYVLASWNTPSQDFLFGVRQSPLELIVRSNAKGADYRIAVYPGPGIILNGLPASCKFVAGVVTCVPTAAQRASDGYTLMLTATVAPGFDSRLPFVQLTAP